MAQSSKRAPGHGTPTEFAVPSLTEARALHAFAKGEATPEQQKSLFNWIIKGASRSAGEVLVPGQSDVTAYLAGRRSVALQIGWVLAQAPESFRNKGEFD